MNVVIKPVDVLFFRDSKPFARGSEHFTKSIFPPAPQTLYGAFRSKALENLGCDYEKLKNNEYEFKNTEKENRIGKEKIIREIGSLEKEGEFILKGPVLINDDAVFVPIPKDIAKINEEISILSSFDWKSNNVETDIDLSLPHFRSDKPINPLEGYISLNDLIKYLKQEDIKKIKIIPMDEIFSYDVRIGLGMDNSTNASKEGLLYTMGFVQLRDKWALFSLIENLSVLPENGLIKLGGANRICEYNDIKDDPFKYYLDKLDEIKNIIEKSKRFKIVLLTPAIFNNGWFSSSFNDSGIKLVSAFISRAGNISGWDLAKSKPKPMRKIVPAGSVYYFEIINGDSGKIIKQFSFKNISDESPNCGFGLNLIGGW